MKKLQRYTACLLSLLLICSLAACQSRQKPEESIPESPPVEVEEPSRPEPEIPPAEEPEEEEPEDGQEDREEPAASEPESQPESQQSSAPQSSSAPAPEGEGAESTSEAAGAPGAQQPASYNTATAAPFRYSSSDVVKMYARNYADYTYAPVDPSRYAQVLGLLQNAGLNSPDAIYSQTEGGFFIQLSDGTKYSYMMIPTAVRVGDDSYPMSQDDYSTLKALANEAIANGPSYVQWLTYMTPANVASVSYQAASAATASSIPQDNVVTAASALANIKVRPGSGDAYTSRKAMNNVTTIQLNFVSGIVYTVFVDSGTLYIESSDMNYGCSYQLETSEGSITKALDSLL